MGRADGRRLLVSSEELEATTGFEPVMGVLQTPALPLGYVAREIPPACFAQRYAPASGARGRLVSCGAEEEI